MNYRRRKIFLLDKMNNRKRRFGRFFQIIKNSREENITLQRIMDTFIPKYNENSIVDKSICNGSSRKISSTYCGRLYIFPESGLRNMLKINLDFIHDARCFRCCY